MPPDVKVWFEDIDRSIYEIEVFVSGISNFDDFQSDLKTRKAVERNLEIIGEALNWILKTIPLVEISNSRKIVDTRNRIIHGYDSVTADVLWLIIQRYLPILKSEIQQLL